MKSNYTILIDAREKMTPKKAMLLNWFDKNGHKYQNARLDTGDFTFEIDGKSFEKQIIIERKSGKKLYGGGFTELKSNFFKRAKLHQMNLQFDKILNNGAECILLIENAEGWNDIKNAQNTQQFWLYSNEVFEQKLGDWLKIQNAKRILRNLDPIKIVYCPSEKTGEVITGIFNEYLKK